MNLFQIFHDRIAAILADIAASGRLPALDPARFVVEPPKDASLGDLATNAAMVFAKEAKEHFQNPRQLAAEIAYALAQGEGVAQAEVAGPGFINIRLHSSVYRDVLRAALLAPQSFGRPEKGRGALEGKVNIEYVSANPTGPMHVGHGRGAVFGDALANLLAFTGYAVTREYYINDAGAQVDVLARSAFLRYREALGETIEIPEGLYPGDYLKPVGSALAAEFGASLRDKPEAEWLPVVRSKAIEMMMAEIRTDLATLDVHHDVFFSERSLHGANGGEVAAVIDELRRRGLIYRGTLPRPKGAPDEDWEEREQTLFRSTDFGDDVDRPLLKSDGSFTYFASDIAYHKNKFDRGFRNLVDVWGADHGGYIKRVEAAVAAITDRQATLDVKIVQLVKLLRGGEPVKMSKRAGEFVTLRDVVDEVGADAVRFMMLFRKNDAVLDFDLAKVVEQSRDNPVFYVQYAHARCHSVFRNAAATVPELPGESSARAKYLERARIERLTEPEFGLIRQLALYPRLVEGAALAHEPHRIAFYLFDLASEFHAFWTRGNAAPHLRFIIENDTKLTIARLALVQGVVSVLASGLGVLGVGAPEEMR